LNFEVLTTVILKNATPCSLVDSACLAYSRPEDVGITFFQNVGKLLPDYIASHPTR
jgi:hypothetical protein